MGIYRVILVSEAFGGCLLLNRGIYEGLVKSSRFRRLMVEPEPQL